MGSIAVHPDVLDKALLVVVDEPRQALAVWKGRGRVDLHDLSGTWHETLHPYSREEEGTWTRDDVTSHSWAALVLASPPDPPLAVTGPTIEIDARTLGAAMLVRATPLGYALWDGHEAMEVYAANGSHLRTIGVPPMDLAAISQLMYDLLEVSGQFAHLREHLTPSA